MTLFCNFVFGSLLFVLRRVGVKITTVSRHWGLLIFVFPCSVCVRTDMIYLYRIMIRCSWASSFLFLPRPGRPSRVGATCIPLPSLRPQPQGDPLRRRRRGQGHHVGFLFIAVGTLFLTPGTTCNRLFIISRVQKPPVGPPL